MRNIIDSIAIVNFVRTKLHLIKLEIMATLQVNVEGHLIPNVILKSHGNKVIFYHLYFTFSVIIIVTYFLKIIDKMNEEVKFDIIPKTTEEYMSVTYGCIRLDLKIISIFIKQFGFISQNAC